VPARALIVDDESPAREELRHLLSGFDDVVVVGEATTAEEAELLISSVAYELVFLDIRMPGIGGVALAQQLSGRSDGPAVVFTTAFTEHAVEAFELGATDYLVKPFDAQRLRRAVDRALRVEDARVPQRGEDARAAQGGEEGAARRAVTREPSVREAAVRIPVHREERIILVEEARIAFAEAARGYTYLSLVALPAGHPLAGADRLLTSYTLVDLAERLPDSFVRTHRSFLVNLRLVREVVPQVGGGLILVMGDRHRTQIPVARRQVAEVRERLGV